MITFTTPLLVLFAITASLTLDLLSSGILLCIRGMRRTGLLLAGASLLAASGCVLSLRAAGADIPLAAALLPAVLAAAPAGAALLTGRPFRKPRQGADTDPGTDGEPDPPTGAEESQRLWDDILDMGSAVADEAGQNLPYCPSMDFSLLPSVVAATFDEEQIRENGIDGYENLAEDLRFLALNGHILPKDLKDAPMEEFRRYIQENRDEIFAEIRDICGGYYKEYTGRQFAR